MRITSLQDRRSILALADAGHTDSQISQFVGWRLATVRKWRRRGRRDNPPNLASCLGRPPKGAMSTFSPSLRQTLEAWHKDHPGWGPKTLRAELERDLSFIGQPLPSRATIARWLKQNDLTRPYERHNELPKPPPASATAPHEEWEMDGRGYQKVPGVGVVTLINLNDRFSKLKLLSYPCWLGDKQASRHPTTADYQLVLRLAFNRWGLPDRLFVDHDSVFFDNLSRSPFPTQLHLWLLALVISFSFGRSRSPTERGLTERSHQTWHQQVVEGSTFGSWEVLWRDLQERRDFLNERLPCASLGEVPPLVAHPEARRPRRLYRPEWEADLLDLSGVYGYLSQGRWYRKGSNIGAVSLGGRVYVLGRAWIREEVEITFDPMERHFVFHSRDGERTKRLAPKGLAADELMGEMGALAKLDRFQLALPFSWDEWRVIQLSETSVL